MARTTLNITGDHVAAMWIAKTEGLGTAASVPAPPGTDERQLDGTP